MKTTNVIGQFWSPDGTPAANAIVYVTLNKHGADGGTLVLPVQTIGVLDADGRLDIRLWPNPYSDSSYRVKVIANRQVIFECDIWVPDVGQVNIKDIAIGQGNNG